MAAAEGSYFVHMQYLRSVRVQTQCMDVMPCICSCSQMLQRGLRAWGFSPQPPPSLPFFAENSCSPAMYQMVPGHANRCMITQI